MDKKVEAAAAEAARWELFDYDTLPEHDDAAVRDKQAFRLIAQAILNAAHGAN